MPPIRMTRAEYQQKYGVKPVVSTSTLDTTPSPIRMTRKEYEETYGVKPNGDKIESSLNANLNPFSQKSQNLIKDIPSDIKETFSSMVNTAKTGASNLTQGVYEGLRPNPKDTKISRTQQLTSALVAPFSAAVNMAGEAGVGAAKLFTTDEFEKAVTSGLSDIGEGVMTTETAQGITKLYDSLPDDQKFTLTKIILPTANVMTSVPVTTGVSAVAKNTGGLVDNAIKTIPSKLDEVSSLFKTTPDKRIAKVASEIAKVEEKYAPLRKANQYSKNVDASRTRIAQSGVLENAVDENGLLQTLDAKKAYKAQTIDGLEDVVRKDIELEGKSINLNEIKSNMQIALMDSGLEGGDLAKALSGIDSELKGLSIRADEFGNIPLHKVHDAKISTTSNINFQTPPETATYRKTLARVYKEMIEDKSNLNIKEVNAELSKYYGDLDRLDKLNGRKVEGGRLGKYTSALAGTAIGMGAGSVGGGAGAAVGGIVGSEVGSFLKGKSMAKTFRGGGVGLPENKILQQAKARVEAGGVPKLKVPDLKVGAAKTITKTPEISKIEGQIAKNIDLQKKAIKAGDFTLVSNLKDVYTTLVERLKTQIKVTRKEATQIVPRQRMIAKAIKPPSKANAISKNNTPSDGAKSSVEVGKNKPESYQQAEYEVETEMTKLSEAGYRRPTLDKDGYQTGVTGVSSTFPKWVPEHLRDNKLFTKVWEHINKGTKPKANAIKEQELMKEVFDEIEKRQANIELAEIAYQQKNTVNDYFSAESTITKIKNTLSDQTGSFVNPFGKGVTDLQKVQKMKAAKKVASSLNDVGRKVLRDFFDLEAGVKNFEPNLANEIKDRAQMIGLKMGINVHVSDKALAKNLQGVLDSRNPLPKKKGIIASALDNLKSPTGRQGGHIGAIAPNYPKPKPVSVSSGNLSTEALKYESAEEYVKAQGNPILHGSESKFKEFDPTKRGINEKDIPAQNAFFFTDSIETAQSYGKNIQERYGNFKKPLTIDADGKMYGDMRDELKEAVLKAKSDGNDVVIIKNLSDRKDWGNYEPTTHYAVLDTNSLKTKSQLTDIYNKAHAK